MDLGNISYGWVQHGWWGAVGLLFHKNCLLVVMEIYGFITPFQKNRNSLKVLTSVISTLAFSYEGGL